MEYKKSRSAQKTNIKQEQNYKKKEEHHIKMKNKKKTTWNTR